MELAWVPAGAWLLVRMVEYRGVFWRPILFPATLLLIAWGCWQSLTLLWSPDYRHGGQEFVKLRWMLYIFVLWPVIDRREWLIASLAAGLLCGHVAQVSTALGRAWNIPELVYPFNGRDFPWGNDPDRNGGWFHPLIAGSMFVASLGLHLPVAVMGRGRLRWLAACASAVVMAGILATGTRSAIVGSMALSCVVLVVAAWRLRPGRALLRPVLIGLAVVGVGTGVGAVVAGEQVMRRFERAAGELRGALERGEYETDVGARVAMAAAAIDAFADRPITGVGAGGFSSVYASWLSSRGLDPALARTFDHAHNAVLHVAATTGIVGVALVSLVVAAMMSAAFGSVRDLGSYHAGPAFALTGLLLVSPIDPVHLNQQTAALLLLLVGLCPVAGPHRQPA
jgi:O-antigen ligase